MTGGGWAVTTGNDIGTMCAFANDAARFPIPTAATSADFNSLGLTGTIPSQFGLLTECTYLALHINELTGTVPTELGNMPLVDFGTLAENELTGTLPTQLGMWSDLTNQVHRIAPCVHARKGCRSIFTLTLILTFSSTITLTRSPDQSRRNSETWYLSRKGSTFTGTISAPTCPPRSRPSPAVSPTAGRSPRATRSAPFAVGLTTRASRVPLG